MPEDWAAHASDIADEIAWYGQVGAVRPEIGDDIPAIFVVSVYTQAERDGDLIQWADQKVYLSIDGIDEAPTINDRLVIAGEPHRIVTVEPVAPGGTVIVYVLQVR
jgi:hypothetical protein